MMRNAIIFSLFAFATVLVIILQPGPRDDYANAGTQNLTQEAMRNSVNVFQDPADEVHLTAPDAVISRLKAGEKPVAQIATQEDSQDTSAAPTNRFQAILEASYADTNDVSQRPVLAAPTAPELSANQQVATDLRAMSWQTLNALNSLGQANKAPGQEGSLLNSIVRRSMGEVGGTQMRQPVSVNSGLGSNAQTDLFNNSAALAQQTAGFQASAGQSYIVASGDTLALIAIKLYGTALATDKLLAQNPSLRQNPNALRIGQVLKYNVQ